MGEKLHVECDFVSRDECREYRKEHDDCLNRHEERLNKNDVENGKMQTSLRWQTVLLTLILGALIAQMFIK